MAKGHVTRKELKHDAVHDAGQSALEFIDFHRTKILTVVLSVLALILVVTVSSRVKTSNRLAASEGLNELYKMYSQAQGQEDAETREAILNPLVVACEEFATSHSGSYFGSEALYVKGSSLFLQEKYEEARAAYQRYLTAAQSNEEKAEGNIALGCVYENQFFEDRENQDLLKKALGAFETGKKLAGGSSMENYYAAKATLKIAQLQEQTGNYTEAKELYEKLVAERTFDDEEPEDEEADEPKLSDQAARAKMFRESLKASTRQFAFKEVAERRLKFIKARQ